MPTSAQEELELRKAAAAMAEIKQRHFPTFAAAPRAVAYLASSDPGLLSATAFLITFATLVAATSAWYFNSGRLLHFGSLTEIELWTVCCWALIGCWSTLGSGRWHLRFPCACLAALWLVAVQAFADDAIMLPRRHSFERFIPQAAAAFLLGAFAAAWIRSIGCIELARPAAVSPALLRAGQFSLSRVLAIMFVAAVVLGLGRAPHSILWSGLTATPRHLGTTEPWETAFIPTLGVLGSLLLAFRPLRVIIAVCGGAVLLLIAAELARIGLLTNRRSSLLMSFALWNCLATGMLSLALASVVLLWLRLWGFRWVRVPRAA
jgi:hypothetical protein